MDRGRWPAPRPWPAISLSSFIKRRLRRPPSSMARGLDQIPESLLPLLACKSALGLSPLDIVVGDGRFWLGELVLSRLAVRARDPRPALLTGHTVQTVQRDLGQAVEADGDDAGAGADRGVAGHAAVAPGTRSKRPGQVGIRA